jgi:hypothetical protein
VFFLDFSLYRTYQDLRIDVEKGFTEPLNLIYRFTMGVHEATICQSIRFL